MFLSLLLVVEGDHPCKRAPSSPNSLPQTRQLHDLRMVNEQIRSCSLILDVIRKHVRIGGLEPDSGTSLKRP